MKKLFLSISVCISLLGYAQGENNNWYFGSQVALNFAGNTPQVLSNSQMISMSSSATISDSNGNLLFYTNGAEVYNREHQVMMNGDIDQQGVQIAISKHPTNPNLYYIISTPTLGGYTARYSVVDMTLGGIGSNGQHLGAVVQNLKKVPILDDLGNDFTNARGVTIVPHADGNSFWVLITTGTKLYSYRLSSAGLNTTPIVSNLNTSGIFTYYDGISLKASPEVNSCNYSHLLSITNSNGSTGENEGLVCSFDNLSGATTTDYNLSIASMGTLHAEFNQYANVLYISRYAPGVNTNTMLYSVDLLNSNNTNVVYNVLNTGQPDMYGMGIPITIQRNTKGDIYFYLPYYNNDKSLGKIVNPDVYGQSYANLDGLLLSNLSQPAIYVGSVNNLPQLVPNLSRRAGACLNSLTLTSPDNHSVPYTYHVSNNITAQQDYKVNWTQNITMKAGNSIDLLPNTNIEYGANYLAQIEDCSCKGGGVEAKKQDVKDKMRLDLRTMPTDKKAETGKSVKVFPNPASDILNIVSSSEIKNVFVTDISGKMINVRLDGHKIDVKGLPTGNYILNVETKEGKSAQRFIKK